MTTKSEIEVLLGQLAAQYGFMIPPSEYERLATSNYRCAAEFVDELFRAEGMEPSHVDRRLYRQVLELTKTVL